MPPQKNHLSKITINKQLTFPLISYKTFINLNF